MGRCRLILLAFMGIAVGPLGAADGAEGMSAVYAFTWGGLEVGRFEVRLEAEGAGYRASWEAGTAGMVGTLFPFSSQGSAEGRREGDRFLPSRFDGSSRWRDGGSEWRVAFAADGRATQVEVPEADLAAREPVPEVLQVGPDPASLALTAIVRAAPGSQLDGQSFDGRRSVRVALDCEEADAGADVACTVSGQLLAGASRTWRERSRGEAEREPWRVWLRSGVHELGLWPVRLEAATRFGTVIARLVTVDGMPAAG